jgi:hypothetical protein
VTPADTIFDFATPSTVDGGDASAVTVGTKFTADTSGTITGIRFYKASTNTGTHVGSLWSADGTLLAQATFNGESASGWQTLVFSSPVAITAGTTYVASYSTTVGYYAVDLNALASGVNNAPLHVPSGGGLYLYGSGFPSNSVSHNYWVDVIFVPSS